MNRQDAARLVLISTTGLSIPSYSISGGADPNPPPSFSASLWVDETADIMTDGAANQATDGAELVVDNLGDVWVDELGNQQVG